MSITYQQHEAHARAVRQDHDGRTSRGLSVEIAHLAFDNPIFRDDPAELLSDLKQCAAACIGAGCEPVYVLCLVMAKVSAWRLPPRPTRWRTPTPCGCSYEFHLS